MKTLLDCNSESCIYKKKEFIEFAKIHNVKEILDNIFKPEGPATNFGLLSNFNIELLYYESNYPILFYKYIIE